MNYDYANFFNDEMIRRLEREIPAPFTIESIENDTIFGNLKTKDRVIPMEVDVIIERPFVSDDDVIAFGVDAITKAISKKKEDDTQWN